MIEFLPPRRRPAAHLLTPTGSWLVGLILIAAAVMLACQIGAH